MLKHVPNILTIIRFLLIPVIIILALQENYIGTAFIFTISGLTDILDGFIARKYNLISNFGKLMDPLADKLTQISILATLALKNIIPIWILIIVILKEIVMICGASFLYGKNVVVSSKWFGKLATVLFYLAIISSLAISIFSITPSFDVYIYCLAIVSTIFACIMYIKGIVNQGIVKREDIIQ